MSWLDWLRRVFAPPPKAADAGRERPPTAPTHAEPTVQPPGPVADQRTSRLEEDRLTLVMACIEVADQVDSLMLRERLADALAEAGVESYEPDGERFDPEVHDAVGRRLTDDATLDGIVAGTQRPGYRDGDTDVRAAEVLVWRHDAGRSGG
jgi:GrpE protein